MSDRHDWLPSLIELDGYGGNWQQYIDGVYAVFHRDFIASQPKFRGAWVRCRRDPIADGKEAGFWHCISEGRDEVSRTPDMRRCERVAWVRAILEHDGDDQVQVWSTVKKRDSRTYLWFAEQFLVALGSRRTNWQLITAFLTEREHTKRKLRIEIKRARNG